LTCFQSNHVCRPSVFRWRDAWQLHLAIMSSCQALPTAAAHTPASAVDEDEDEHEPGDSTNACDQPCGRITSSSSSSATATKAHDSNTPRASITGSTACTPCCNSPRLDTAADAANDTSHDSRTVQQQE
jgi:hypothetical protein